MAITALGITIQYWITPGIEERRRRHAWEQRCHPIRSTIRSHADATEIRCIMHECFLHQDFSRERELKKLCSRMDGRFIGICQECRQGMLVVATNHFPTSPMIVRHCVYGDSTIIRIRCNECHRRKTITTGNLWLLLRRPSTITIPKHHKQTTINKHQKIRWQRRS